MQKQEIEFLLSAGYTLAEIMQMQPAAPAEPAQIPDPEPEHEEPAQAPDSKPEPQNVDPQTAAQNAFNSMMDDMRKMFEQNMNAMQAANIRNAVITGEENAKTPEDLIANIIHPTMKERDRK